ncbi:NAD(P)-dependent oxidoreductase [Gloeocapsa sp. PCC 73106]|uniref:NAD-dependent epimerase/dehydratase family protein n=1 Tax=Gloeocapsa sp. PCC 73106 TaxID=102232 RepID=UPI0002AC4202|nr:NAD(P)-dependent oxidoreductase [Gloeocapsa sp. PCC 73106]ELR97175.1 nucleoside-diphosphate-sugar epimerase [Gloeocapsa sp. PCC 73106]
MQRKRIFLTGGSGCIGHYLAEALIQETEHELYILVRNPQRLHFDYQARPGITVLTGDLKEISKFAELLPSINIAILAATAWGGKDEVFDVNVRSTIELINLLDPIVCEQVIYFSTASILDHQNQLLPEAKEIGTNYIQTKYQCYTQLSQIAIAPKITTLFPTLVLGGDDHKPYSHISSGLPNIVKWIDLARWFKADGSFHFIHARDIAQIVNHLVANPPETNQEFVLGNEPLSVNQAMEQVCLYLDKRILVRIPLSLWLANLFIKLFYIRMADWDRFCLNYRHFTYQNFVNPARFGLTNYCSDLADALKLARVVS